MNELVNLIVGLAWPAVVLIVFFSLKGKFGALIDRTKHFKHKDTEVGFNEQLNLIANKADETPLLETTEVEPTKIEELVNALIEIDPYSAILAAWVHFSESARDLLDSDSDKKANPARLIEALSRHNYINYHDAEILNMIRGLRNDAAHHRSAEVDSVTAWKVCKILLVISDELTKKQEAGQ